MTEHPSLLRQWHSRPPPLPDESLSSWLVRISSALVLKLQTFTTYNLNQSPQFWGIDVDRVDNSQLFLILSEHTNISLERCLQTSLHTYTGTLWEKHTANIVDWILPLGKHGRYRMGYGQQYCRACLAEGPVSYFRLYWRLAFHTCCLKHQIYLRDSCPTCQAPIQFHTNDYRLQELTTECLITTCSKCHTDLRDIHIHDDIQAPPDLLTIQNWLNALCENGYGALNQLQQYKSLALFTGLRTIIKTLTSHTKLNKVNEAVLRYQEQLPLQSTLPGKRFETLRVGDRAWVLKCLATLLDDWPNNFIELYTTNRISSSYLHYYRGTLPFWLAKELDWHLYDKDYIPSFQEREAAKRFLENHYYPINQSNINLLVGTSAVSAIYKIKRHRWNPRGAPLSK